ncbi:AfsR/SARP family transcriptional regulator [Streptomyces olivaceus]|uniref:AfsR/SARP family transcriptional regulator n=1 Tax=Streptomyces olivaceus TaxID=47716 RepID=UPI004057C48E
MGGVVSVVCGHSLRFAVLGVVRAWRGERELDVGSPQQRVVLAALLLRRGRPVSVAGLVDAVWGKEPPAAAVAVVRTYVSRLRKVLEPGREAGGSWRVIVSAADGYRVCVPECCLDLGVFERQVTDARQLRAAGETAGAAELLRVALEGWEGGSALAGLPGPLAVGERSRLAEEWLSVLETRLDVDLQLGRHSEVVGALAALTVEHPLRERLRELLMLALYRSGRQAEALAVYRETRRVLVTELGIEPGAALRELHERILAADPSLDIAGVREGGPRGLPAGVRQGGPPESVAGEETVRPAQLPADLFAFTGREGELARAQTLLPGEGELPSTVLISAIGGMAGVGKTALAVHLAHRITERYPDGQLYINLRGSDPAGSMVSPSEAVRIFLDALGVPPRRIPASPDAQVALYRSLLAGRRVLILLDNARDSEQVRPLLPGCPRCLVIVTSRNQLIGLIAGEGASPLTLSALTPADAHSFLLRRIGAARLAAEPRATDEIITRCAGLPLALAIVAARAATHPGFPLEAIAKELRDSQGSLDAFAGGEFATDIRAVFASSYEALSSPAARLLRLLGLGQGPDICAPVAAALAGLPLRDTRNLLTELTRAHLLTEHAPGRYTLHDLLRVYATERLATQETPLERDRAVERLLCWYLHTADAASALLTPHRPRLPLPPPPPGCQPLTFTAYDQALAWCESERPHLVAAVHQAAASHRPDITWRLTAALWGFFHLRSHLHDWLDTTRTALDTARSTRDRAGQAASLNDTAAALTATRRYDEAISHSRRAMTLCRELGDTHGRAQALDNLGNACLQAGRLDKAVEYTRRALALHRVNHNTWGQGIALANLGDAYQRLSRYDEAITHLEQALTLLRASGNRWTEGLTLDTLGTIQHRLNDHDNAVNHYHLALRAHRDTGNRHGESQTLNHLGNTHQTAGRPTAAHTHWQQALTVIEEFHRTTHPLTGLPLRPDPEEIRRKLHYPRSTGLDHAS